MRKMSFVSVRTMFISGYNLNFWVVWVAVHLVKTLLPWLGVDWRQWLDVVLSNCNIRLAHSNNSNSSCKVCTSLLSGGPSIGMETLKPENRGRVRSVEQRAQSGGGLVYVSSSAAVLILLTRVSVIAGSVTVRFPYFRNVTQIKQHEKSSQVSYL